MVRASVSAMKARMDCPELWIQENEWLEIAHCVRHLKLMQCADDNDGNDQPQPPDDMGFPILDVYSET